MEDGNKIIPPHLNAEVYRTDTTGTNTMSYLDYICFDSDESALIGSSELTGRYWNGSANILTSISDGQNLHNKTKKNICLNSGTADGCFIGGSSKVLLCEDSGAVSIWSTKIEDIWGTWVEDISVAEHDDAALGVVCLDAEKEYVTVGGDGNIKVWDINELICVRNYNMAHCRPIHGVSGRPNSTCTFATGSLDCYVTMWDDNIYKPVLELIKNDCGIRCLQWLDEYKLLFGDEAGVMSLLDIRKSGLSVKLTQFPAAVHKLVINAQFDKVAVCCDNNTINVCHITDNEKANIVYSNRETHKNYVRGAAWAVRDSNVLYTCAWDSEIKRHVIKA